MDIATLFRCHYAELVRPAVMLVGDRPTAEDVDMAVDGHAGVFLGSDASGRHLLLAWERHGWIDHGRLRPLPPQGGAALTDAW